VPETKRKVNLSELSVVSSEPAASCCSTESGCCN
jgi:hypothetical protein